MRESVGYDADHKCFDHKTGFNDRIYMIGETKFGVKQYNQITNNISWGEAVSQNVHREGIFEPFILIHRTKDYKLTFFRV